MLLESVVFFLIMATVIIAGAFWSIREKPSDKDSSKKKENVVVDRKTDESMNKNVMVSYDYHEDKKRGISA